MQVRAARKKAASIARSGILGTGGELGEQRGKTHAVCRKASPGIVKRRVIRPLLARGHESRIPAVGRSCRAKSNAEIGNGRSYASHGAAHERRSVSVGRKMRRAANSITRLLVCHSPKRLQETSAQLRCLSASLAS